MMEFVFSISLFITGDLSENKNDLVSSQLFHVAPFSNMLLTSLGGEFTKVTFYTVTFN